MKTFLLAAVDNNPIEIMIRLGVLIWTNPLVWIVLIAAALIYGLTARNNGDHGPP